MHMMNPTKKRNLTIAAAAVLLVVAAIAARREFGLRLRPTDRPPQIEFSWSPAGAPVTLRGFEGHLTMRDDWALDFTTYRLRIPEIGKEIDLPIEGMVGKSYESPIYLGLLDGNPALAGKTAITLEFSIADDKGQKMTRSFVIPLRTR